MVRDEFLGAAGFGGGGGGGGEPDPYPSAAFILLGLQTQPSGGSSVGLGPGIFRWSASGLGTKHTNPPGYGTFGSTTNPNYSGGYPRMVFNRQQNAVIGYGTAGPIGGTQTLCQFSATFNGAVSIGTSYGTYYNNMPSFGTLGDVEFHPSGNAVVLLSGTTIYARSFNSVTGWGAALSVPSTPPSGTAFGNIQFAAGGNVVLFQTDVAPYIHAYLWSSSGFGAKLPDPSPAIPFFTSQKTAIAVAVSATTNVIGTPYINSEASGNIRARFYNITTTGFTLNSEYSIFDGGIQVPVTDIKFSNTGGSIKLASSNITYIYGWADSTGVGSLKTRFTIGGYPNSGTQISSDATYIAAVWLEGPGVVATGYRLNLYNYTDASGVGALRSTTVITPINTVTFLTGSYFT